MFSWQVPHCGYCQNGILIQAADLLATTKRRQNTRTDGDFFRWTAVLEAAVSASGYKAHVPASNGGKGNVVEGWGMAIGTHGASRAGTVVTSGSTSRAARSRSWSCPRARTRVSPSAPS